MTFAYAQNLIDEGQFDLADAAALSVKEGHMAATNFCIRNGIDVDHLPGVDENPELLNQ